MGGFVLGTATIGTILLAMFEVDHFWIANALVLGLVLAELSSGAVRIAGYRRGV